MKRKITKDYLSIYLSSPSNALRRSYKQVLTLKKLKIYLFKSFNLGNPQSSRTPSMSGKKGFSLIQAMVAMFIFSILSLGAMEMMANFAKYMKYTEQKEAVDNFAKLVKETLKNKDACKNTFGAAKPKFALGTNTPYSTDDQRIGVSILNQSASYVYVSRMARATTTTTSISDIKISSPSSFNLVKKFGNSGLYFHAILMKDYQTDASSGDADPDAGEVTATVEVILQKENPSSSFGGEYMKREFPVVDVSLYTQDDVDNGAASGLKDTVKSCSYFSDDVSRLPASTPPPTTTPSNCPAQTGITKHQGSETINLGDVAESPIGTVLPLNGRTASALCMGTYKCKDDGSWEDNISCVSYSKCPETTAYEGISYEDSSGTTQNSTINLGTFSESPPGTVIQLTKRETKGVNSFFCSGSLRCGTSGSWENYATCIKKEDLGIDDTPTTPTTPTRVLIDCTCDPSNARINICRYTDGTSSRVTRSEPCGGGR